jgi:hypothetical protein
MTCELYSCVVETLVFALLLVWFVLDRRDRGQ